MRSSKCVAALAGVAAAVLVSTAPASANHVQVAEPALPEAQMRSFETWVLGSQHAAEHARQRRLAPASRPRAAALEALGPYAPPRMVLQAASDPFTGPLDDGALTPPSSGYDEGRLQATADDPRAQDGAWSPPFGLPLYAIHAALLPTGKVLWFGPPDPGFLLNTTWAVLWDPISGELERVDPPLWKDPADGQLKPANIYCAGQAFLSSGELLVAGGTLGRDAKRQPYGLNKVYTFDPFAERWTEQPDMEHGRWYPTNVQLPDGRQAIMSGSDETSPDVKNETIEVFAPGASRGDQGTLTTLVDANGDPAQRGSDPSLPPTGALYPHMFAMPSGKTLVSGPYQQDSWYLHTPNPATSRLEWSEARNLQWRRNYGNAVLLPPPPGDTDPSTTVMQLGGYGSNPGQPEIDKISLDFTETFDESEGPNPLWKVHGEHADHGYPEDDLAHRMKVRRSHQNTVLLPDGTMVQVGGGEGADLYKTQSDQHKVELWTPNPDDSTEGTWRFGAAQADDRAYHSTAILLPDGRVVSAGDDGNPVPPVAPLDTAEVYEPPYLFKGPRPTISFAPDTIELSDAFDVETPDTDIDRAVLIAPGATTHANDMHQRYVPLALTEEADGVQLTAPANENVAPPGYYMLFLVDDAGVPSVAKFVKVISDQPDAQITIAKQTVPDGAAESFAFTGDLGSFSLSDGAIKTETVPAGLHDVTESAFAGWGLTSLACSDGSATDLISRRVRIEASPGEAVTCTFTNAPLPNPPAGGPSGGQGGPGPGSGGSNGAVELNAARAAARTRAQVAKRLGNGTRKTARKVRASCRQRPRGSFRCTFKLRGGDAYRGVLWVWGAADGSVAKDRLTYKGTCGSLGRGGPRAIKTRNVPCPAARGVIRRWYVKGRPAPRGYDCRLKARPKTGTCDAPKKSLSFRYRSF